MDEKVKEKLKKALMEKFKKADLDPKDSDDRAGLFDVDSMDGNVSNGTSEVDGSEFVQNPEEEERDVKLQVLKALKNSFKK